MSPSFGAHAGKVDIKAHAKHLRDRLGDTLVDQRGFRFLSKKETHDALTGQGGVPFVPSIEFFYWDLDGKPLRSRYRLLVPNDFKGKYRQPTGTDVRAYFPLLPDGKTWKQIAADVSQDLIVTEGEIKAIAGTVNAKLPTIGLGGVEGWHTPQSRDLLPDLKRFKWKEKKKPRRVWVIFDSNIDHNPDIRKNAVLLGDALAALGADPQIVKLTDLNGDGNTGLDDFLVHPAGGYREFQLQPRYRLDSKVVTNWRKEINLQPTAPPLPPHDLTPIRAEWLEEKLPPQEFLLDKYIPRGTVVLLIAEGAVGKTELILNLGESVASGVPFFGLKVRQGPTVVYALEDPEEVLRRRLYRIYENRVEHLKLFDPERLKEYEKNFRRHFSVISLLGQQLRLANLQYSEAVQNFAVLDALIEKHVTHGTSLIVPDPLARLHGLDENNNAHMTVLVNSLEYWSQGTGSTVVVPHHVSKANATTKNETAHAGRGASALSDAARVVLRLRVIDKDEAKQITNVTESEQQRGVLRLVHAKNNYGPKCEDLWLKRGEFGGFDRFEPEFKGVADYTAFLNLLQQWINAQPGPVKLSQNLVSKKKRVEIFKDAISKGNVEQFYGRMVADGTLQKMVKRP